MFGRCAIYDQGTGRGGEIMGDGFRINGLTIGRLHTILADLISQGHARKRVCVQKDTFYCVAEDDGAVILGVVSADLECFPMMDEDGGTKILTNGQESCHTAVVLKGDHDPNDDICLDIVPAPDYEPDEPELICTVCEKPYRPDESGVSCCCDVCGRCGFCEYCAKPENHDCDESEGAK